MADTLTGSYSGYGRCRYTKATQILGSSFTESALLTRYCWEFTPMQDNFDGPTATAESRICRRRAGDWLGWIGSCPTDKRSQRAFMSVFKNATLGSERSCLRAVAPETLTSFYAYQCFRSQGSLRNGQEPRNTKLVNGRKHFRGNT
jgi:hypothetical protein